MTGQQRKITDLARLSEEDEQFEKEISAFMERITGTSAAPAPQEPEPERPVRVDFGSNESPFRKAEKIDKRLKVFLWGPSGAGKTVLALHFPKPAVIDLERGTECYGDQFKFEVLPVTTADELEASIDWLLVHPHDYRTLVIDPITVYWEALQKKWSDIFLRRNKGGKGFKFEFYDTQPRDWNTIKAELKETIRKLLALDMNVIVTARSKVLYEEGAFMKSIGETFDGEKSLPYLFDVVLRQWQSPDGKFFAETIKDRTNKLPKGQWEINYEIFEKAFGARSIARKAAPVRLASQAQKDRILELAKEFRISEERLTERLQTYGAENLDELTKTNADVILEKLEAALAIRKPAVTPSSETEQKETGSAPEAGKEDDHAAA